MVSLYPPDGAAPKVRVVTLTEREKLGGSSALTSGRPEAIRKDASLSRSVSVALDDAAGRSPGPQPGPVPAASSSAAPTPASSPASRSTTR